MFCLKLGRREQHSLGEVCQVLGDLSDEGERPCCAVVRVLLHQIEKRGGHDGRTEKPQEQGRADQTLADVRSTPVAAFLPPWRKHLFQLSWKDAAEKTEMINNDTLAEAICIIQISVVLAYYLHLIWTLGRMLLHFSVCFCICQGCKQREQSRHRFDCNHSPYIFTVCTWQCAVIFIYQNFCETPVLFRLARVLE